MDISRVVDKRYIYLTTKGRKTGKKHTVELWFAVFNGKIYLSHEGGYTDWMKNILNDSCVDFKIGTLSFKGVARIIKSESMFEIGKNALYHKYYGEASKEVIDDWFSQSTIVEIFNIEQ
jgi:hypothetical protein